MKYQMIYELNHTYMVVSGEEIEQGEDYRYRMLASNILKGILPLEIRRINGEKKIYIDLTGKETVLNFYNMRKLTRSEIRKLFEAIYVTSEEMERYLIGESDIILSPEMIFRNAATGEYEFVCIPLVEEEDGKNDAMLSLLHFIMMHIDNEDEKLVNAIYSINDMYENGNARIAIIYEYYVEETEEEAHEIIIDEKEEDEPVKKKKRYRPSLKEVGTLGLGIAGLILVSVNLYLSFI